MRCAANYVKEENLCIGSVCPLGLGSVSVAVKWATDVAMKSELICEWLGLPAGPWPPDHYCLLGLTPGEADARLIEQSVQQRLESVRRYQMMHPEQATEAMNRLAQAYICLTEPASKQAYDAELLGSRGDGGCRCGAGSIVAGAGRAGVAVWPRSDPVSLRFVYPAARRRLSLLWHRRCSRKRLSLSKRPKPLTRSWRLRRNRPRAARHWHETSLVHARRGHAAFPEHVGGTRQAHRIAGGRISRSNDGPQLNRLFAEMVRLHQRFPRLIGAAGQPGYLVLVLSEQEDAAKSIRALDPSQRGR